MTPLSQESFQPQQKLQQYNSISFCPFFGFTNWEIGAAGNQCTVWCGFSPAAMAPRLKVHRRKHAGICISRREIKSRVNLLERRHFKIWEHSWIPKVNYTISQMFQELLFHFFLFPEGKVLVHKKTMSRNCYHKIVHGYLKWDHLKIIKDVHNDL